MNGSHQFLFTIIILNVSKETERNERDSFSFMILFKIVLSSSLSHPDIACMACSQPALRQARAGSVIRLKLQSHVLHPPNPSSPMQPGTSIAVPN